MMYSYLGLERKLREKGIRKSDLSCAIGVSSRTIAKISKCEKIASFVLKRIANYLECDVEELCREFSDNAVLQTLRDEKDAGISGGLYHELQIRLTYNSNHIEGSALSEEETRLIFETRTINSEKNVSIDDIIETSNHFRCIDYCIDVAEEELSENIIKRLHYLLRQGTKDSDLSWFAVGEYKQRPNVVGGKETCSPGKVSEAMRKLLRKYNAKEIIKLDDIIEFHAEFEKIHPFQDGNGRVGRLIAFKECLRFNIIPFIIEDSKKAFYYRGLSNWDGVKEYLLDTCKDGQDEFKFLLGKFGILYE